MRWLTPPLVLATTSALMVGGPITAQQDSDLGVAKGRRVILDQFDLCGSCSVDTIHAVTLGETNGPGELLGDDLAVAPDGSFVIVDRGGTVAQIFNSDGVFQTKFGRSGQGPGEFRAILRHLVHGSSIYTMDFRRSRLLIHNMSGEFIAEYPTVLPDADFVVVDSTTLVIARSDRSPSLVGLPLHQLDLQHGEITWSGGSTNERFSAAVPYQMPLVMPAPGHSNAVWLARKEGELAFELWSLGASAPDMIVAGAPEWFPEAIRSFDGRIAPPTIIRDFAVDAQARLWVLSSVADDDWESGIERGVRAVPNDEYHPYRVTSRELVRDLRLDVFDLSTSQHIQGDFSDSPFGGLAMTPAGEVYLYSLTTDEEELVDRMNVYMLALSMGT